MSDVSTRRALEIVLSRVSMHRSASDTLRHALAQEIDRTSDQPAGDIDGARAALELTLYALDGADEGFPKSALVSRIQSARAAARRFLEARA